MKTYVLTLSQTFPKGHMNQGEATGFKEKLLTGKKIHTIRANYPLWLKRIEEINKGNACLSIRQWSDKPYRSKQIEIARLTKENGVGIEQVRLPHIANRTDIFRSFPELDTNDGLTREQWLYWFAEYDTKEPLAIIHFTPFRYFQRFFKKDQKPAPAFSKNMIEAEKEKKFKEAMRSMDRDTMARTIYLPFVMQDVFFDFVDTAMTQAAYLRIDPLKKVCRTIKQQRSEYEFNKRKHLDSDHRRSEENHMEEFIDEHFPECNNEYKLVKIRIREARPAIDSEWLIFIACIYMALIIYKATRTICREADEKIEKAWGYAGRTIMTDEVIKTHELLKVCLGDCAIIPESDTDSSARRLEKVMHECSFVGEMKWD